MHHTHHNPKTGTKLETYAINSNWYITRGHIKGKYCIGYGSTPFRAIADAFRDYSIIINL